MICLSLEESRFVAQDKFVTVHSSMNISFYQKNKIKAVFALTIMGDCHVSRDQ